MENILKNLDEKLLALKGDLTIMIRTYALAVIPGILITNVCCNYLILNEKYQLKY